MSHFKGWSKENSESYAYFQRFGSDFNNILLFGLAEVVSTNLNISLYKDAQKNPKTCFKWFDDYFHIIRPFLDSNVCIVDSDYNPIENQSPNALNILNEFNNQQDSPKY